MQVTKFVFDSKLSIPEGAKFLDLGLSEGQICLWFLCKPEHFAKKENRMFYAVKDGENLGHLGIYENVSYLGTVHSLNTHIFELLEE